MVTVPLDNMAASGQPGNPQSPDAFERLVSLLDTSGARYRIIEHPPEGRTEIVSAHRGHDVAQAAKCLIVMVKLSRHARRYVLAVVPGDTLVDLKALQALAGGSYVGFASKEKAEALAGSPSGTILPFTFHRDLELVVDPALLTHGEIFFNAARLDRSMALSMQDYLRIAQPRVHPIAVAANSNSHSSPAPTASAPVTTDPAPTPPVSDAPAYVINDQPVMGALEKLDVQRLIDDTTDHWYNQTLCQVGDVVVRLGVLQGQFHWHKHDEEDEFFLVLDGMLHIELHGMETIRLGPRQGYIVPKGLLHRPVVPVRTAVLMLEQAGVVATGD